MTVTSAGSPPSSQAIGTSDITASDTFGRVWTEDDLVAYCTSMNPSRAADLNDSSLCVSPLIECVVVDGTPRHLQLQNGRWGAGVVRVSTIIQRSGRARATNKSKRSQRHKVEGYSEEEQIRRAVRYFVSRGLAFRLYSDAGVTGEMPNNDPAMIKRLWQKKSARYRKIFMRTLLDDDSLQRRTADQIASMRAYLERRCRLMEDGTITEEELYGGEQTEIDPHCHPHVARIKRRASHRQAFTQLWIDVEADSVSIIGVAERSRLCRDADLETAFLEVLAAHGTRLHGLFEDLSIIDVGDPLKKGVNYMIASLNEHRIEEITSACFRGVIQLLESGLPNGRLPWWLRRDEDGRAQFIEGGKDAALRCIDLYLDGLGKQSVARQLYNEGFRVNGKPLSRSQIHLLLTSDAITGVTWRYGLAWQVYPEVTNDPSILAAIRERLREQRDAYPCLPVPSSDKVLFAGLLRCSCGSRMRFQRQVGGSRTLGRRGMWLCQVGNAPDHADRQHAGQNHAWLVEFIRELVKDNPNVLNGALAASLGGADADRASRRAILEKRLQQASQAYEEEKCDAETKARITAQALGMSEGSARFASLVREISEGLLEEPAARLASLRTEVNGLRAQTDQDRRAAEFREAVASLGTWDDLDPLTQNRLLRSVIESITVFPRNEGAHVVFKLVGVDTPLPPIRRYSKNGKQLRFPSPGEWIAEAFCGESQRPIHLESKHMLAFRDFVRRASFDGAEEQLAQRIRTDATFPRRATQKASNLRHLENQGISPDERRAFHAIYDGYVRAERERAALR